MAILATETLALEVGDTLGNGFLPGHVVSSSGQDVSALLAGPVLWQGRHACSLDLGAETQQSADVLLQHEVVVDAAGHVSVPHVQGALTINLGRKLRTDNKLEDSNLLSEALLSQQTGDKVPNSGLTLITGDGLGVSGDSRDGSDGKDEELHDGDC